MPHGADFLRCLERVRSAQNTEESTPCTLSTKIEPDSRGTSPAMTKKIAVDWRFPIPFYMICIISYSTGASMADQTVSAIAAAPRQGASPTVLQIAVLAALAATGTLATNILLPSLPQMAVSLKVSSAAGTSAITVFLAVFALGPLVGGPVSERYGRRWPVLIGFAVFLLGSIWCGLADDLPGLLPGRVLQAGGACLTS